MSAETHTHVEVWIYRYLNEMGQSFYENAPDEVRNQLDDVFKEVVVAALDGVVEEMEADARR